MDQLYREALVILADVERHADALLDLRVTLSRQAGQCEELLREAYRLRDQARANVRELADLVVSAA